MQHCRNSSNMFSVYAWLITRFVTRLIRWVPLVEQKLFTLPEHLSSPQSFSYTLTHVKGHPIKLKLKDCCFFLNFVDTLTFNDIMYEIRLGFIHIFNRPIGDELTIIKTWHIVRAVFQLVNIFWHAGQLPWGPTSIAAPC
jgi:hypothetical protein